MDRKAQAAIEFIMTYGWAIIIAIVAVNTLISFGAFDQLTQFARDKCKVYGGFYCKDFKIDGKSKQVVLALRNSAGYDANDVEVKIKSEDCSGATTQSQGALQAANNIVVTGDDNTVNGGALYSTTFTDTGEGNAFNPAPAQYTESFPQLFSIEDYKPGGSAAIIAQSEGKYSYITGDFTVDEEINLDGLYYVTGKARLNEDEISGVYTLVSEGEVEIKGEEINGISYIDDLIFFSNAAGDEAIELSGDEEENMYAGYFYAPNGEIRIKGDGSKIDGGILGSKITLTGEDTVINYVPINGNTNSNQLKIKSEIPNPWINGQTVLINFTCLGDLERNFEADLEIGWYLKDDGALHNAAGKVKGKAES